MRGSEISRRDARNHGYTSCLGAKPPVSPHIHMNVTGGGLMPDQKWRVSSKQFYLPVRVLSAKFRRKFLMFPKNDFQQSIKSRILSLQNGTVTSRWRDYAHGNRKKLMTLDADEFIRRFLLHILPVGFRKIRHYGLFASRNKGNRLSLCRWLSNTRQPA